MIYLLVTGGQVLNTGVAKRFIRNALWEEGEPYLRIFLKGRNIRLMQVALFLFTFQEQWCVYETHVTTSYKLMTNDFSMVNSYHLITSNNDSQGASTID